MRRLIIPVVVLATAAAAVACGPRAGTVEAANDALGAPQMTSIQFSGTGRWYQFGQAPNPTLPWPQFDVSSYTATVDYARAGSSRADGSHTDSRAGPRPPDTGRAAAGSIRQRHDCLEHGAAAGAPAGSPPAPQLQPAAVEERVMEIWTTPHGFLKAAGANNATAQPGEGGTEVSFSIGKNRYVGTINEQNEVAVVRTWIDNPVLGDTEVQFNYSDYMDFSGVRFPSRIVRVQGGHPVLDITVSSVTANPGLTAGPPTGAPAPAPVTVTVEKLANGVYYLKGGTHHSVAIDQKDHIVVVEAPQNEERSLAVIAKVKETIPNKPIRYLINSHVHFDHSGGLRTYVDEGATIVTHRDESAVLREGVGRAAHDQSRPHGAVEEDGDVRDVHREARPDRWRSNHRDSSDRRRWTQRRLRDGVPAGREDPDGR